MANCGNPAGGIPQTLLPSGGGGGGQTPASNANLSGITVTGSDGVNYFTEVLSPETTTYTVIAPDSLTDVTVNGVPADSAASVVGSPQTITQSAPTDAGVITVSSKDGAVTKTYTLTIKWSPYKVIPSLAVLKKIGDDLAGEYELTSDINLDGVWTPIGDNSTFFTGKFHGNGHSIKNLTLPSDKLYTGLFGVTIGAFIEDLSVELAPGAPILTETGVYPIGVIAGAANNTNFNNIHVSGGDLSVTGGGSQYIIGGIAGQTSNSSIRNSSVEINISVDASSSGMLVSAYAGGIAGINSGGGTVENCYAAGDISADASSGDNVTAFAGGIAGSNSGSGGTIKNCYAAVHIRADASGGSVTACAGGIAGINRGSGGGGGTVENCYAAGDIRADASGTIVHAYAGGIAGVNDTGGTIKYSAALSHSVKASAVGSFSSSSDAGRVCGYNTGTLDNNIAYSGMSLTKNNSPVSPITADPDGINGTDKTSAELKTQATYAGLGWSFPAVWKMGPPSYPYPILKWQNAPPAHHPAILPD
jgi:hypothetical protein